MKKSIKRIISFALMLSLLVGMMAGFSAFAAETETVEIISKNLYYGDTFNIMYAVNSTSDDVVLNIYTMNDKGELELAVTVDEYITDTVKGVENAKVFTSAIGVPAQNIDKEFYAQAVAGNTKSEMVKYSVLEYLYERLTVSEGVTEEQATMYNSLLAFADAADVVVNKDTTTNIAKYAYVRVTNGTVDGTNTAAMVLAGTALDELTTTYVPENGKVLAWNIAAAFIGGTVVEDVVKDSDLKAGEFTVDAGKVYNLSPDSIGSTEIVLKTDTMAYPGGTTTNMTGSNDAAKLGLDASIFSVIGSKGGTSNNCGLNKDAQIRLYGNKADGNGSSFTVKVADGYTIQSIKITFYNTTNNKNCQLTVDGVSEVFNGNSATWAVDIDSDSFTLKNVITGATTQIYIKSIEITYYKG